MEKEIAISFIFTILFLIIFFISIISQKMKNFIMFFDANVGSSAILWYLKQFEKVCMTDFEPYDKYRFIQSRMEGKGTDISAKDLLESFELIFSPISRETDLEKLINIYMKYSSKCRLQLDKKKANGFKFRRRLDVEDHYLKILKKYNVVIWFMLRKNFIQKAFSSYHGDGKGNKGNAQFGLATGKISHDDIERISVNIDDFKKIIDNYINAHFESENLLKLLKTKGYEAYSLYYENFLDDKANFLREMLNHIKVEYTEAEFQEVINKKPFFKKVHKKEMQYYIINYEEVKDFLFREYKDLIEQFDIRI
jgi:hypothetical protein